MNRTRYNWLLGSVILVMTTLLGVAEETDTFSKVVSFQFEDSLTNPEVQTPFFSPVVSYQFQESLAQPGVATPFFSPVVSYQYFEWPGDENLTFQYAPSVSYYFGGGVSLALTGTVNDPAGVPISGAEVILQRHNTVFWQGLTAADGSIPAATLPSGNFNVMAIKAGYSSLFQSVPGDAGGPLFLNLTLHPALEVPPLVTVNRSPQDTAIRQPSPPDPLLPRPPAFKVFSGTGFSADAPLDPNRMTVVICHGWNPDGGPALTGWATTLAYLISTHHALAGNAPNIIGWDWSEKAHALVPPIDEACNQGEYLGLALHKLLGTGYHQRTHFIGHSLGAIVNAYACDYVHGSFSRSSNNPAVHWDRNLTRPHVTLLDEGEIATVFGQSVITASSIGSKIAQAKGALLAGTVAAAKDWKKPIPASSAWADNFISLVGVQRDDAVNVCLLAEAYSFDIRHPKAGLEAAHAYAHLWYRNSIGASGVFPQVGFKSAYEASMAFPPSGPGLAPGSLWYENLDTAEPNDLRLVANPQPFEAQLKLLAFLSVSAGAQVGSTFAIPGQSILNGYEAGISWVGDLGGTAIVKTGQVAADVSEKLGNLWDAALDKVSTINPDTLFSGNLSTASLRMLLSTPAQGAATRAPRSSVSPPQAWIPIQIPADAAFLVFDFTVTGNPGEDQIACAINEQNLFTLPARFAPDGSPVSTDFLDVSAYAGQQAELYFGLVGGTSSGCTLAIDGIRFVTIPMPKLATTVMGDQVRLNWPAAAVGWVLQRNPGLAPEGWEDVALPETVSTVDGVVTLDRARSSQMEFFRLRRAE